MTLRLAKHFSDSTQKAITTTKKANYYTLSNLKTLFIKSKNESHRLGENIRKIHKEPWTCIQPM